MITAIEAINPIIFVVLSNMFNKLKINSELNVCIFYKKSSCNIKY